MKKLNFICDYLAGAHEKVLEALVKTNMELLTGYGTDPYTASAKSKIKKACGKENSEDLDIYFLMGGTQTNSVVISSMLSQCEGVISATTGHVAVHEAGAIEYTGHKVITVPGYDGKIKASDVLKYLQDFYDNPTYEHMVFPGMVYISHPTEYGSLYTKQELKDISAVCREYKLPLYIDGARLGYGIMSRNTDVTMQDIVDLSDVFYIGGTKVGALCGEAVVFTHGNTPRNFYTITKTKGAMLAKGRLISIQFDALFTDDLYFQISRHAIDMAEELKNIFKQKGYKMFIDSPTNQQFVVLENNKMKELADKVDFEVWEKYDDNNTVVRFATSWSTQPAEIAALAEIL